MKVFPFSFRTEIRKFQNRNKTRMSILATLIQLVLEVLATAITRGWGGGRKDIQIGKEDLELALFEGDMILYIENSKESTNKLLK